MKQVSYRWFFVLMILSLILGGCASGPRQIKSASTLGMTGSFKGEAQQNGLLEFMVHKVVRSALSSSPTGVRGTFATTAVSNKDAINTKVVEGFTKMQEVDAEPGVLFSVNSLPAGIVSKLNSFSVENGYKHQWLGCFKLVTEPKAKGTRAHMITEAQRMTAAAGGDFVFIPPMTKDLGPNIKWADLGGCSFKLDPRVKQQLEAQGQAILDKMKKLAAKLY